MKLFKCLNLYFLENVVYNVIVILFLNFENNVVMNVVDEDFGIYVLIRIEKNF